MEKHEPRRDPRRVYQQSLETFKVLLDSKNPDHYKKSGAMLHALYENQIVTSVSYGSGSHGSIEELEADQPLGLSYDDVQFRIRYAKFYNIYYNQMLSFDLSYGCCHAYEDEPTPYDFTYLQNMCHYLWKNEDLSVDSFSMMFRSLMHGR